MLKTLQKLCTPAHVYFLISLVSLLIMAFQNLGNVNKYCVGNYECTVTSTLGVFAVKMLYVVFWTWVLNTLPCRLHSPLVVHLPSSIHLDVCFDCPYVFKYSLI